MKKQLILFFLIFCFAFSLNQKINQTQMINLVVNNSIYSKIKINEIICSRSLIYEKPGDYEYCVAEIEFIPPKKINACTFTHSYCMNFTINWTIANVHPTLWLLLFNDSEKHYYNETLDSDIYINNKIYLAKLKFVGGIFEITYVERERYSIDLLEIIIYLLILGIAYYIHKLRKKSVDQNVVSK